MTTFEALGIVVAFLLPGALFELGIEREVGYWRTAFGDRTLRFLAISALVHAVTLPVTVALKARYVYPSGLGALSGVPWTLWLYVLALLVGPYAFGLTVGAAAHRGAAWTTLFMGRDPAPRAWDFLFGRRGRAGYVRIKLRNGGWIGGTWAAADSPASTTSYASSFPQHEDLYLAAQVNLDPETGAFVLDQDGRPAIRPWGLLLVREEIERLEFQEVPTMTGEGATP